MVQMGCEAYPDPDPDGTVCIRGTFRLCGAEPADEEADEPDDGGERVQPVLQHTGDEAGMGQVGICLDSFILSAFAPQAIYPLPLDAGVPGEYPGGGRGDRGDVRGDL